VKAVVMAGGEGTRLRPMTANQPKPLLPVVNRPIMEHVLRLLKRHGFEETVVTVQFLAALVRNYFGDGEDVGMSLRYATEETPLGTAGSVKNAEDELRDDAFLVISGDALTDMDLTEMMRFHKDNGALVTVGLTRVPDPLEFGIVIADEDGRIQRFLEKPTWGQVFSDTVNTGVYIMEPEVLAGVSAKESGLATVSVSLVLVLQQPALLGQHAVRPRRRVPQLHPVDGSVHEHLVLQLGERPQMSWNRHTSLPIDFDLGGVRCPDTGPVPIGATRVRLLLHRFHLPLELPGGPQRDTALGVLSEIAAPLELPAELHGQDHPAFRVERMLVSPYEP